MGERQNKSSSRLHRLIIQSILRTGFVLRAARPEAPRLPEAALMRKAAEHWQAEIALTPKAEAPLPKATLPTRKAVVPPLPAIVPTRREALSQPQADLYSPDQ